MEMELHAIVSVEEDKCVPNGAIYVARVDWLRDALVKHEFPFDLDLPRYVMTPACSIDIDVESDLKLAEAMIGEFRAV